MSLLSSLQVTVVGLGLMGGSLALALRPHVRRLVAVDTDPAVLTLAQERQMIDAAFVDLAAGVQGADLVVLATPVRTILALLAQLPALRPEGCLLLDLGSTKEAICRVMAGLPAGFHALGSHPLCGKETAGLAAADAALFQGQTFVLCAPAGEVDERINAVALEMVAAIGARPLFMPPAAHDQIVALTSHLPYLLAALLMQQAAAGAAADERVWPVSATGLRGAVRLAGSDPQMMADILLTNRPAILTQLHSFGQSLAGLAALLEQGDEAALLRWLTGRQAEYDVYRQHKPS